MPSLRNYISLWFFNFQNGFIAIIISDFSRKGFVPVIKQSGLTTYLTGLAARFESHKINFFIPIGVQCISKGKAFLGTGCLQGHFTGTFNFFGLFTADLDVMVQ